MTDVQTLARAIRAKHERRQTRMEQMLTALRHGAAAETIENEVLYV